LAAELALILALSGCRGAEKPAQVQFLAMDTVMSLTAYGDGAREALEQSQREILRLEKLFSVTDSGSEIYAANHGGGAAVPLSPETAQVVALALEMAEKTGGAVDPTVYPVVAAWGFTGEEYRVPDVDELARLLTQVDYSAVQLEGDTLTLPSDMEIDLGSIAKGWTADRVVELWRQAGLTSGCLTLGGNVQTLGTKPDGSLWRVGVQDPGGSGYVAILTVSDRAVVTSGGYERYFEQDGEIYWHIMDPATGYPARTGLASVTAVGPSGAVCDALSTALFVMGLEKAHQFWRENRDFEAVFILEDGSIAITAGLEDSFQLASGWEETEVKVLE